MPHVIRQPGLLGGTALAVFMALVHTVNDAITAILGALLPTLQERFDAGPTLLAVIVAVFWIASSVTQPVFGAIAEDLGLRVIASLGVLMAAAFLSLIGVASQLVLVFILLVIGGLGSAALHPVGTTIAGSQATNATLGVGLFTAGGMVGFAFGPVFILYLCPSSALTRRSGLWRRGSRSVRRCGCCFRSGSRIQDDPFGACSTGSFFGVPSASSPWRACSARLRT